MQPQNTLATMPTRLPGADLLRVLATVGVITIHASQWPAVRNATEWYFWTDFDQAARWAVPAFLVLSGIVLAYRYGGTQLPSGFLIRRARRSLLPFVVWSPVYLLIGLFVTHAIPQSSSAIIAWSLAGAGHLWFLLIIPQFYVLYMFWPRRRAWIPAVTLAALAVQLALCGWRLYGTVPAGLGWSLVMDHGFEFFPFWIGYFAVGLWLGTIGATRNGRSPVLGRISLAAIPLAAVPYMLWGTTGAPHPDYGRGTGGFLVPLLAPLAVAICVTCILCGGAWMVHRSTRVRTIVATLSTYSLGIYIVHPFLLNIPGQLLGGVFAYTGEPWSVLPEVLLVMTTLLMSLLCVRLLAATVMATTLGVPVAPLPRPAWLGGARP